jgi:hypothetical protein
MIPVQNCIPSVLAEALRRQPLTPAKLGFCWRLAVGPAVHRATRVAPGRPGEIVVDVFDPHWKREVERCLPLVRNRLEYLLGAGSFQTAVVRQREPAAGPTAHGR